MDVLICLLFVFNNIPFAMPVTMLFFIAGALIEAGSIYLLAYKILASLSVPIFKIGRFSFSVCIAFFDLRAPVEDYFAFFFSADSIDIMYMTVLNHINGNGTEGACC